MCKVSARVDGSASLPGLTQGIELICRTDSLAALRAAVDHGADSVRLRWRMRNEPSGVGQPVFQRAGLRKAVHYARDHGCSVCLEISPGYTTPASVRPLLEHALEAGIDEFSLSCTTLALYLRTHYPALGLRFVTHDSHLSRRALSILRVQLGITRVMLPPVVSLAHLFDLSQTPGVELEVQGWGGGSAVVLADRLGKPGDIRWSGGGTWGNVGLCSDGSPASNDSAFLAHASPDPSLALALIPELARAGMRGVLIETTNRSPARMAHLTTTWRAALDDQTRANRM